MGKEGFWYYLGILSGAQFCLTQGEGRNGRKRSHENPLWQQNHEYKDSLFCWLPSVLAALCRKALEAGIEEEFVQDLIRKYNLFPEMPPYAGDTWPWPVKIYVLGKFELVLDGKPLSFTGKMPKRPLLLLKMLIALGGEGVREEQLTDLLWPEADGDRAHSVFTTTLSRLRRLIGFAEAIEIHSGKVSINPRFCWVDMWAYEEICSEVECLLDDLAETGNQAGRDRETVIQLAERAVGMYGGSFLPGETNQSWAASLRERLNSRFQRFIIRFGGYLEHLKEWGKAAQYYQMTLEMDETADEELYRSLMICHHQLGQPAKVIEAYRRCSRSLQAALGIRPSPTTEIIYKNLVLATETATDRGGTTV